MTPMNLSLRWSDFAALASLQDCADTTVVILWYQSNCYICPYPNSTFLAMVGRVLRRMASSQKLVFVWRTILVTSYDFYLMQFICRNG